MRHFHNAETYNINKYLTYQKLFCKIDKFQIALTLSWISITIRGCAMCDRLELAKLLASSKTIKGTEFHNDRTEYFHFDLHVCYPIDSSLSCRNIHFASF